jgi:hypothetical protein
LLTPCRRRPDAESPASSRRHLDRGVAAWGDIFDDTTIAAAMLDRLLHRSVVLNINGDSYRMRAHRARSQKLTQGGDA